MPYPKIFKDNDLNIALENLGYVTIPFLSEVEVDELVALYPTLGELPDRFYSSTHVPEKDFQLELKSKLDPIVARAVQQTFSDDTEVLGGALLNKPVGQKGILPLHQDWNIVDESVTRSFNIWIPLTNVAEKNGAVKVLEKSHKVKNTFRGPNLGLELTDISEQVIPHLNTIGMKAGEALIHDHALWHASGPNLSKTPRRAMVMGCKEKDAEMKYYYQQPHGVVEYNADVEFYLYGNAPIGPGNLSVSQVIDHQVVQMGVDEFNEKFLGVLPQKKGWISRIKEIFTA